MNRQDASSPEGDAIGVLARGGLILGGSTAVGTLLAVPTTALLVRSLGLEAFGTLIFALGLAGLTATVADLGLANVITRMSAFGREGDPDPGWARSGVELGAVSGALGSLACVGVAFLTAPSIRTVLLAASALPLVTTIRSVIAAHLRAHARIALVEGSYALGQVLYCGAAIALAVLNLATAPRVAVLRWVTLGAVLPLLLPSWVRATTPLADRMKSWRRLLRFSLPLLLAGVAWLVLQRSDVVMLGFFRGPRAVGLYSPVLQSINLCTVIIGVLSTYYLPVGSGMVARANYGSLRSLYTIVTKWGLVLTAPLLAALIVAPGPLLGTLFGQEYNSDQATLIARILAVGYAVTVLTGQNGFSLIALGRFRSIGIRSGIALVVNVAINALLIPAFGPVGAAIGTSTVYVGLNIANSYLIWRIAGLHPLRADFLLVLGAAAALTVLSVGLVAFLGLSHSIAAPLLTTCVVGVGCLVSWFVTSSSHERRSWFPRVHQQNQDEPTTALDPN